MVVLLPKAAQMQNKDHQSLLYRLFVLEEETLAQDIERKIFRLITLPNGTTKSTSSGRLDSLNEFSLPFLKKIPSAVIKDIAVSSGICSVEWADQLRKNNCEATITATDLFARANLVIYSPKLAVLTDTFYNPLLIEYRNSFYRTSFPTGSLRHYWGKLASRLIKICTPNASKKSKPIMLLSLAFKKSGAIGFIEEDITSKAEKNEMEKYDVIRAANILNKVYFSENKLKEIIENIACQIKKGGLLIVGKTDSNGVNHAQVYTKTTNGFASVGKLNNGAEVDSFVVG